MFLRRVLKSRAVRPGKSWGRPSYLRITRQSLRGFTVVIKISGRKLAFRGVKKVGIGHELVVVEWTCLTECRCSRTILNRLGCRDKVIAIGQFRLQYLQRNRVDIETIRRDSRSYAPEFVLNRSSLSGKNCSYRCCRSVICKRRQA